MSNFFEKLGRDVRDVEPSQNAGIPQSHIDDAKHLAAARRWSARDGIYWGASESCDALPAGMYSCGYSQEVGPHVVRRDVKTDGLLHLPDEASAGILAEFSTFWLTEKLFRERGFLMKRGFLLWGPPGSGKTVTVNLLSSKLIEEKNGIILIAEAPGLFASVLRMVRKIEPSRPIVAILEDLDALVRSYGESEYLSILDGEAQADNAVFVATTNYPERLDKRFVDRPSRFDTIKYIGMPNANARRRFLEAKEPSLNGDDLDIWVRRSEGFSVAHLKEMIIAVKCLGQSLDEVVNRLEQMQERNPTSDDVPSRNVIGFGGKR